MSRTQRQSSMGGTSSSCSSTRTCASDERRMGNIPMLPRAALRRILTLIPHSQAGAQRGRRRRLCDHATKRRSDKRCAPSRGRWRPICCTRGSRGGCWRAQRSRRSLQTREHNTGGGLAAGWRRGERLVGRDGVLSLCQVGAAGGSQRAVLELCDHIIPLVRIPLKTHAR